MRPRLPWWPALLLLLCAEPAQAASGERSYGVWRNPQDSVHIRVHPCGKAMCGTVVWANDKAQADARRGGTETLVGAQLFRNFRRQSETVWRGKVFVPDLGKTFSGTVTILDPTRIEGKGCLVGRLGCKSQVWVRVAE